MIRDLVTGHIVPHLSPTYFGILKGGKNKFVWKDKAENLLTWDCFHTDCLHKSLGGQKMDARRKHNWILS